MGGRNIIFVAGLHGDEQSPVKALSENGINFILGSPKAREKGVRFTEQDLNASFGIENDSYESKRAAEILKEIDPGDFVVDFHTTFAITPPFAIVVDEKMIPLAAQTGLEHVVIMKHNIKDGHALINRHDGISIESGRHDTEESYDETLRIVRNIQSGKAHPIKIYEVYGKITEPGEYDNFVEHSDGFIPVLAGEKAYDFYGLKAKRVE